MKSWNISKRSRRKVNFREELPTILIVCEGKKTEPNYFKSFRVLSVDVKVIPAGRVHLSVVKMALKEMKGKSIDQVWCVFDRDKNLKNSRDAEQFNEALALAERNGIRVAYSNDSFELWYLLHFTHLTSAIDRADYIKKLNKYLPEPYSKANDNMYDLLEPRMNKAIKSAKKLYNSYASHDPANNDPSTTVHLLVEILSKYSRNNLKDR